MLVIEQGLIRRLGWPVFPVSGSLAGAIGVLAFAPFDHFWLLPLGQALLLWLLMRATPRQGLAAGYGYGLGMMGFGVWWLQISLAQFAYVGELAATLYTLAFIAAVALYYGVMGWLIARLGADRPTAVRLLLIAPSIWVLLEWLRGWWLTGFPWLIGGHAWIDTPLAGYAPLLGSYALSLLGLLLAGSTVLLFTGRRQAKWLALSLAAVIISGGWFSQQVQWHRAAGEPFQVSLIQANIQQSLKWKPEHLLDSVDRHLQLTRSNWDSKLIIWPETAVPAFAQRMQDSLLWPLEQDAKAHDAELLVGIPRAEGDGERYYNTLHSLGGEPGHYAKRHLVPFGEYAPFRSILKPLVDSLGVEMSDFMPGTDEQPLLKVLGYQAGISICYEDAFASELIEALPEANFLINVSNDGWFGDSLAPWQHLQIARMRALETGRYLLRATNTGVSAIIGPAGEVLQSSPLMKKSVVRGEVIPLAGETPYVRWGNLPILLLLLVGLVVGQLKGRWRPRSGPWSERLKPRSIWGK